MLKEIPGYEGYLISKSGNVLQKKTNQLLRISVTNNGFMYVTINGKNEYIHDLIAIAFLGYNPSDPIYPIHKDGDSLNNHVSNIVLGSAPETSATIENREHRHYSSSKYEYEVYNESTGDSVICIGRGQVAELIQYEEISLKNMIGNGRIITLGPYEGYKIRRVGGNK